jgi:hypothetical protein
MKKIYITLLMLAGLFTAQAQQPIGFSVQADADDWQLYMSSKIMQDMNAGAKMVFITITAGDEGKGNTIFNGSTMPYYKARELGSVYSAKFATDITSVFRGLALPPAQETSVINGHTIAKYIYRNTVSYFLRLPDGGVNGDGYTGTGFKSLKKLKNGTIASLTSVDGANTYNGWNDLNATILAIINAEKSTTNYGWLHTGSLDITYNPNDNSDHIYSSIAAHEATETSNRIGYIDYVNDYSSNLAANLSTSKFQDATGVFAMSVLALNQNKYISKFSTANIALLPMEYYTIVRVPCDQISTSYIVYAQTGAKFDENNFINGDVGVTAANGKAEFRKNSVLDPYKVRAFEIKKETPSTINNTFNTPATGGPVQTFLPYTGNTANLISTEVAANGTLNGNWKDVKVKKGVTATITGNDFGKITIEEGAIVTFTATTINMIGLQVQDGKQDVNLTTVKFNEAASVKVKENVEIRNEARVNIGGPKVDFYVGDGSGTDREFKVNGKNTQVAVNVMVPNGKLRIDGGAADRTITMTGLYIVEKLEGNAKYVYWNRNTCSAANTTAAPQSQPMVSPASILSISMPEVINSEEIKPISFSAAVYPNPSTYEFTIMVNSNNAEPINIKILDVNGNVKSVQTVFAKSNIIKVGSNLPGGTYIAEIIQGKNRRVLKLIKLN